MKYCPLCGKEYAEGEHCEVDGAVLVTAQPAAEQLIGQVLKDSYRIVEQIGQGGMATVFRGVQIPLDRDVAVKVMLPSLQSTPSMIQRFFQEAKLLCQLSHPNVVAIIDFGNTESGMIYMVMEYLRGTTLQAKVPSGGLSVPATLRLMRQICSGVGAAHNSGLVHRDLKPDNIFIVKSPGSEDRVKILDFGIARAIESGPEQTRLTQTGLVMGTPGFLAPEQIGDAAEADARSDIYALGAVLYLMLTGLRPYSGNTPNAILTKQLREPPPLDIGRFKENRPLADVVQKAMHRLPEQRYQTPDELVKALDAVQAQNPTITQVTTVDETIGMASQSTLPGEEIATQPIQSASASSGEKRSWLMPALIAVGMALVGAAFFWFSLREPNPNLDRTRGSGAESALVSTARGISEDQIRIGMSGAFSGSSKELGRAMRLGIDTCFKEVNDGGGIHERRLKLVALDDGYEPSRTVANMAELLHKREIFALLGNVGTPTAEVAIPLALEQKAPFFGAFTGTDLLRKQPPDPLVFNFRASYSEETAAIVKYFLDAQGFEPSEIVVFAQEDSFGDAGYRGVVDMLKERGYSDRVPRLGYRRNKIEVDSAVDSLLRMNPKAKAVVMVATYRAAAELIQRLKDQDAELTFAGLSFIGSRALAEELHELGPEYAEGVIVTQVVPHYESQEPGVARYRHSLASYFPSEQPGFVSLEGYLACRVFTEGLERAGAQLTADSFIHAVESISSLDLGIASQIRFGPERHQGSSKVWGTILDRSAAYQALELTP